LDVKLTDKFPQTLAELQSYDAIFLCNISAGDLGLDSMRLLESAVRDFGVGVVCIGGDQTYAAGGYRGTPLESLLPVEMELNSKKVLPNGALAIVCHATEFPGGNGWARDIAFAALEALGPQDEMGIVLWDGNNHWLFPLAKVGTKTAMGRAISGMNPGDMPSFQAPMEAAYEALVQIHRQPQTPDRVQRRRSGRADQVAGAGHYRASDHHQHGDDRRPRRTGHDVLAGGGGHGRFWAVDSASDLPQIFIKEASVILKSAIFEEPFKPQLQATSEIVKGIGRRNIRSLLGYVCTTPKGRAEVPLVTQKGDPLLAHWQYGLGRAVAFTSDARAKWAANWLGWDKFQQFWQQVAQWSLRRVDAADFNTEVAVEKGEGHVSVEAIDADGHYRNFLNLQLLVVSPKGEKQVLPLEQTGPGHYDATFPTKEVGAYLMNLTDRGTGQSQALGLSVNYSPEFDDSGPNTELLRRLAELGGGKILDPDSDNPFSHDRKETFQPLDLRDWLLKLAILLFPLDVAVRRIQIDRAEWLRVTKTLRRWLMPWSGCPRTKEADESLSALLARAAAGSARSAPPSRRVRPCSSRRRRWKCQSQANRAYVKEANPATPAGRGQTACPKEQASVTSRLLDAKRRAQKRTG
jgi:Ca-activated chloride channel homolog